MKLKYKIFSVLITLVVLFSLSTSTVYADDALYLGGMPAGFTLYTRGAQVVGVCDVITENGLYSPAKTAGIEVGDKIIKINDFEINNAEDIEKSIKGGGNVIISYKRNDEEIIKNTKVVKDINGQNKLGVFIKDGVSGIGTITFIKGNRYASLGHPVLDQAGECMDIRSGQIYSCDITGSVRGERGRAGELKGIFIRREPIAVVEKNLPTGVYGSLTKNFDCKNLIRIETGCAVPGEAHVYSTVDGSVPKKYSIMIIKVDDTEECKNFVIKITDKELLEKTGGIVQGMSGSPIVQNDKLVGAVTHVFINDPTRGFGIKIDKMLNS